jgi:hypothetical protein
MYPLIKIRIAVLIVSSLATDIQAARPADLPLRPKHSHGRVIDRQRDITPAAKEILFQQFLEWQKQRADQDLRQNIPLLLRSSLAR